MELILALLLIFCLEGFAWIAGIYLLIQWIRERRQQIKPGLWVWLWSVGWLFVGVAVVYNIIAGGPFDPMYLTGGLFGCITTLLWIVAWFLFRKSQVPQIIEISGYGEAQGGVWPPPPTDTQN